VDTPAFNSELYRILNPDLRYSGVDLGKHYSRHGKKEGRPHRPDVRVYPGAQEAPSGSPTLSVWVHDGELGASVTALAVVEHFAPSHALVVVMGSDGPLREDFLRHATAVVVAPKLLTDSYQCEAVVEMVVQDFAPVGAVVNSVSTWHVLPFLAQRFVPAVTLVHEFVDYVRPDYVPSQVALWSSRVVFSSRIARDKFSDHLNIDTLKHSSVIHQAVPGTAEDSASQGPGPLDFEKRAAGSGAIRVVGAGRVQYRKGVDLFIESARQAVALRPDVSWQFVWFGAGYAPAEDIEYSAYLRSQVVAAGLEAVVSFPGVSSTLREELRQAHLLVLPSRLDPFPNVAVEALSAGTPVVCFDGATGTAEFLSDAGLGVDLVVPSFDPSALATAVVRIGGDSAAWKALSAKCSELYSQSLTPERYGGLLESELDAAMGEQADNRKNFDRVRSSAFVDLRPSLRLNPQRESRDEAIVEYLRSESSNVGLFRPIPEFNPRVFGHARSSSDEQSAFVAFLDLGSPPGPWLSPVKVLDPSAATRAHSDLHDVVHIHVHYPELVAPLCASLAGVTDPPSVLLSSSSPDTLGLARDIAVGYGLKVIDTVVTPNRGRNFGPLLALAATGKFDGYDLVCHVHTKKSPQVEAPGETDAWRNFLIRHLLGDGAGHGVASEIMAMFSDDRNIGLVFPYDPILVDPHSSAKAVGQLKDFLNLTDGSDDEDFPVGGMFWIRRAALVSLAQMLASVVFDEEPIAADGTVVHAIERLLPTLVRNQGLSTVQTYVPGVRR
jgi:glycosyltransferase involved in cell wall biosynthesis